MKKQDYRCKRYNIVLKIVFFLINDYYVPGTVPLLPHKK